MSAASCSLWDYHGPVVLPRSFIRKQAPFVARRSLMSRLQRRAIQIQGTSAQPGLSPGPDISRLAPNLRQEWDYAANTHLGSITIKPKSNVKAWWSSGRCKTGQPHKWQAMVHSRSIGGGCPYNSGRAVCPCNDLAHNHPGVAAEWDWEANGSRTPETVTSCSGIRVAWRCGLCGHRWSARVLDRTRVSDGAHRTGCPQCAREARRIQSRQPSISVGAPHLVAEWDWEANKRCGWYPDHITLGSRKKVHWVVHNECKLGLVHRWQASPLMRVSRNSGSPFLSGNAVCACNSLAVQCSEAADLWHHGLNGALTPHDVTVQSKQAVFWLHDGRQWHQGVRLVVLKVRRRCFSEEYEFLLVLNGHRPLAGLTQQGPRQR